MQRITRKSAGKPTLRHCQPCQCLRGSSVCVRELPKWLGANYPSFSEIIHPPFSRLFSVFHLFLLPLAKCISCVGRAGQSSRSERGAKIPLSVLRSGSLKEPLKSMAEDEKGRGLWALPALANAIVRSGAPCHLFNGLLIVCSSVERGLPFALGILPLFCFCYCRLGGVQKIYDSVL